MRGRAPEETAGDNPDDALRLMDGSQIASYREAVFEGPSSDRREASASYLLGVPQARCRKKKENLRLASSDRWHPSLVFTSVAASVRSCWLPREGRGKQRPPRSEPPPHTHHPPPQHNKRDTQRPTDDREEEKKQQNTQKSPAKTNNGGEIRAACAEHVPGGGHAKWWQRDDEPAAQRAPSSVHLMESVRCGATERWRMLSSAQPASCFPLQ